MLLRDVSRVLFTVRTGDNVWARSPPATEEYDEESLWRRRNRQVTKNTWCSHCFEEKRVRQFSNKTGGRFYGSVTVAMF